MPPAEPDWHWGKPLAAISAFYQEKVERLPSETSWHWEIIAWQYNRSSWEALITFIGTIYSNFFDLDFESLKLFGKLFVAAEGKLFPISPNNT